MSNANELAPRVYGIVIVHGPLGSGKTSNARALMQHFGCTRLVDGWRGDRKLQPGDLVLTHDEPPFPVPGATVLDVGTALMRMRRARQR